MGDPDTQDVRVLVLGPLLVRKDSTEHAPSALQKRLLGLLALAPRRSHRVDTLQDALWGAAAPSTARASLQNQVARLRRAYGEAIIETTSDGYLLSVGTDLELLRDLVRDAETQLGTAPEVTLSMAEQAQALIRGEPFSELSHLPATIGTRVEVDELVDGAADLVVRACLELGRIAQALPEAARLHAERPLDEQRAIRLVRAYESAGRRGDALATTAAFRRMMRTELGLAASAELDAVESALLSDASDSYVSSPDPPAALLQSLLLAVAEGRHTSVVGVAGSGVSATLRALRRRLNDSAASVALAVVGGFRDVAVAPLLDLLDELGMAPDRTLGPVGSFSPMVQRAALQNPVVLILDDADLVGPSTQMALREVADLAGVTLVLGGHDPQALLNEVTEVREVLAPPPDRRATHRRTLAALPERVMHSLAAAEIARRDVTAELLTKVGAAAGLEEAISAGLLVANEQGRVEFSDVGMREVIRRDTPTGLRTELHHAMGRAMATDGMHADAAHHLLAAVRIEPGAAVDQAREAAALARAAGAHRDAAHWLRTALDRAGDLITEDLALTLMIELGDALRLSGDPKHVEVLNEAIACADRIGATAQLNEALFALLQLGGTTANTPLDTSLVNLIDRAVRLASDPDQSAPTKAAASLAYSLTGNAIYSRDLFRRAERCATDPATRRRVLPFAYMALAHPSDLLERRCLADELLTLAIEYNDPAAEFEALHLLFSVLVQTADGAGARTTHSRMTELVDLVGDVGRRWSLLYLNAALAHFDDELVVADEMAQTAYTQFAPVSEPRALAALHGQLFGLSLIKGDTAELTPFLELLVADQPGVPAWNAALALALSGSDATRAIDHCLVMLDAAEHDATWLVSHLIAGRAAALVAMSGNDCESSILDSYTEALDPYAHLVSWQGTCSYGPVATTLALLARARGETHKARTYEHQARHLAEQLSAPAFIVDLDRLQPVLHTS